MNIKNSRKKNKEIHNCIKNIKRVLTIALIISVAMSGICIVTSNYGFAETRNENQTAETWTEGEKTGTINIANKVITVNGTIKLKDAEITGPATIILNSNSAFLQITGDTTIKNVTIKTSNGTNINRAAITHSTANITLTLENVIIQNISRNATEHPTNGSAITSTTGNTVNIKGTTRIVDNTGGAGAVVLANSSKINIQGNLVIKNNKDNDGNVKNYVHGDKNNSIVLSGTLDNNSYIGITATEGKTVVNTNSQNYSMASFKHDNSDYGLKLNNDNNIEVIKKKVINIENSGNYATLNISNETGENNLTKAFYGEALKFKIEVSNGAVLRDFKIGGVSKYSELSKAAMSSIYEYDYTMPDNDINVEIVAEPKVSEIILGGITVPTAQATANTPTVTITQNTPSTANLKVNSVKWLDSSDDVFSGNFDYNKTYKLCLEIIGEKGDNQKASEFASSVAVVDSSNGNKKADSVTVSNSSEQIDVIFSYTTPKKTLANAVQDDNINVTITNYEGVYDGQYHAPNITVNDVENDKIIIQYSKTQNGSYGDIDTVKEKNYTDGIAKTVYIKLTAAQECEYTGEYTTTAAIKINRRIITPVIDLTDVTEKKYDETTDITGAKLTFDNIVSGETLVLDTDYSASFALTSKAAGTTGVNANSISLKSTTLANNYSLSSTSAAKVSSKSLVEKATPKAQEGSITHSVITRENHDYSDLNLEIDANKKFYNETKPSSEVEGNIYLTEDGTAATKITSGSLVKNKEYTWLFVPNDTTNYTNATGKIIVWQAGLEDGDLVVSPASITYDGKAHQINAYTDVSGGVLTYALSESKPADSSNYSENPIIRKDVGIYNIWVRLTHANYPTTEIIKNAEMSITQMDIKPVINTSAVAEKDYDGTNTVVGASISFINITGEATPDTIDAYTADYSFVSSDVGNDKIIANNIVLGNAQQQKNYNLVVNNAETLQNTKKIKKATPVAKADSIRYDEITQVVSLSAINLTTQGAIFGNPNNASLEVIGTLQLKNSDGSIMTAEEMNNQLVVQGKSYGWLFTPNDSNNYNVLSGTKILWPMPTNPSGDNTGDEGTGGNGGNTGGGGGTGGNGGNSGGGGGTGGGSSSTGGSGGTGGDNSELPPDEVITTEPNAEGVIIVSGEKSNTLKLKLPDENAKDVIVKTTLKGDIVKNAINTVKNANVVVDENGKPIAKAVINGDSITLYAKVPTEIRLENRSVNFIDTNEHWGKDYVEFCAVREIMQGVGEEKFDPDAPVTRAMPAVLLYRLEGSPDIRNSRNFPDVTEEWFKDAISWAGGSKIVNGIGTTNFAPYWEITREQLAVMIYNYATIYLDAERVSNPNLSMYGDSNNISDWAKEAVAYCTEKGLMKGQANTGFYPTRTATRAELAAIMERLVEAMMNDTL